MKVGNRRQRNTADAVGHGSNSYISATLSLSLRLEGYSTPEIGIFFPDGRFDAVDASEGVIYSLASDLHNGVSRLKKKKS